MIVELATLASVGVIGYLLRGIVDKVSNKDDVDGKLVVIEKDKQKTSNDINEPVLSFIETFKKHPRRFSFDKTSHHSDGDYHSSRTTTHEIADHLLGKVFKLSCRSNIYSTRYYGYDEISWMTQAECELVVEFFTTYFENRRIKLQQIKNNRARRDLIKLYAGE